MFLIGLQYVPGFRVARYYKLKNINKGPGDSKVAG